MFTGIVEEVGRVSALHTQGAWGQLEILADTVLRGTKPGDSIAVNGVCLTVTDMTDEGFRADVMAETLRRSNLGALSSGSFVNLERAMAADGRFGGHMVSGHIDAVGEISKLTKEGNAVWVSIRASERLLSLVVEKGSIAIDGISLTVAEVSDHDFSVSVIPHTGQETTLLHKQVGDGVNLEQDIVGKYVEKLLGLNRESKRPLPEPHDITLDFLQQNGF